MRPRTPPIIQSLWIGKKLSVMERLCICSFLKNGHPFHLYIYNNVEGIPQGVTVMDASRVISPDKIFKYKDHDSYAGFSNLFRYKLLLEKGNYWVDTDVVCLQPLLHDSEYVFASERMQNGKLKAANCLMRVPADSPIIRYCYDESVHKNPLELRWGETGPDLLTKALNEFDNMWSYMSSPEIFCPVNWWDWKDFVNGSPDISTLNNAHTVHLWHEMWRRSELDKSDSFGKHSMYEQLKERFLSE